MWIDMSWRWMLMCDGGWRRWQRQQNSDFGMQERQKDEASSKLIHNMSSFYYTTMFYYTYSAVICTGGVATVLEWINLFYATWCVMCIPLLLCICNNQLNRLLQEEQEENNDKWVVYIIASSSAVSYSWVRFCQRSLRCCWWWWWWWGSL